MNRTIDILENTIAERALKNLESHSGIKGEWIPTPHYTDSVDGTVILNFKNKKIVFTAEIKNELRQHQLNRIFEMAHYKQPLLVIARQIFPAIKERLRQEEISYLDSAGNVYISHDKLLVWIEGNKAKPEDKKLTNRAFTKTGLKVVYVFFENIDNINRSYREIADLSNVALGTITTVIAGLKDSGYLLQFNKKEVRLQQKKELLERWVVGYREILKPSLLLGTYQLRDTLNWRNLKLPESAVWGGEAAANLITDYLNPQLFTIYTRGTKSQILNQLQLIPKSDGNVKIYHKFWADKQDMTFEITAPIIVTYADLLMTEDPRCIETAEIIYNLHIKQLVTDL